ncbi:uncharacterized protein LOC143853751 [Tasmannia lanceolata]|uniref:uncharacterized protein LOC143853751 n=1 Tax=Tasmannia lanceolata TaxID=3420 RepID=UPI0040645296
MPFPIINRPSTSGSPTGRISAFSRKFIALGILNPKKTQEQRLISFLDHSVSGDHSVSVLLLRRPSRSVVTPPSPATITACKFLDEKWDLRFTVIVAQKNHHTKFFQPGSPDNVPPAPPSRRLPEMLYYSGYSRKAVTEEERCEMPWGGYGNRSWVAIVPPRLECMRLLLPNARLKLKPFVLPWSGVSSYVVEVTAAAGDGDGSGWRCHNPNPSANEGQKTGRFFWSFGFLLFFFNLQKRRGGAASPPLHRGKDVEERGSQRRSMLSFRETKGNASFECSLAGSCVACHYSEKEFDYYEYDGGNSSAKKSELDLYLEEPKFDRKHYANMDILVYWRDNHARYPVLSILARDLMSIPITTVASESAFSIGAKVLTKYRTSIRPENAQAVICSRNWLFGYEIESDDPSDEQLVVPLSKNLLASVSRESTTTNALEVAGTIP